MTLKATHHVIIATDFSENSHAAIDVGRRLASNTPSRLTLVHSFNPDSLLPPLTMPPARWSGAALETEAEQQIQARLTKLAKEKLGEFDSVETVVLTGRNAAMAITAYAEEASSDWLVVGTHGRSGIGRLLIGSVAEQVVRHATGNVVVARSRP